MSLHFLSYLPENSSKTSTLCCLLKITSSKYNVMKRKLKVVCTKHFQHGQFITFLFLNDEASFINHHLFHIIFLPG